MPALLKRCNLRALLAGVAFLMAASLTGVLAGLPGAPSPSHYNSSHQAPFAVVALLAVPTSATPAAEARAAAFCHLDVLVASASGLCSGDDTLPSRQAVALNLTECHLGSSGLRLSARVFSQMHPHEFALYTAFWLHIDVLCLSANQTAWFRATAASIAHSTRRVGAAEALARAAHEHALSIHAQLQAQQLTAAHLRDDAHYAQAAAHRASLLASTLAAWAVYSALGAASFSRLPPPPRRSGALPRLLALTALLALALEVVLVLRRGDGGLAPPQPLPPTTTLLPPLPPGGAAAWSAAAAASSYDPDPAPAAPASPYFVSPRTQDLPALLLPVYYALAPRQGVLPLLQLQALVRTLRALYAAVTAAVLAWAWGGVVGAAAMREVLRRWGLRSGGGSGGGADGSDGSSSGGEQRGAGSESSGSPAAALASPAPAAQALRGSASPKLRSSSRAAARWPR